MAEHHTITVQRGRIDDHPLLGPSDTVTYRVAANSPGDARRKVEKIVEKRHPNWSNWTIIKQDY